MVTKSKVQTENVGQKKLNVQKSFSLGCSLHEYSQGISSCGLRTGGQTLDQTGFVTKTNSIFNFF